MAFTNIDFSTATWENDINNQLNSLWGGGTTTGLTWYKLPLVSGLTNNFYCAPVFGGEIIILKGKIGTNSTISNGMVLSTCEGTPLQDRHWKDMPAYTNHGIATLQTQGAGQLAIEGLSQDVTQIVASGIITN